VHIARQTPQELVVVAGTRRVSAICAAAALFTLYLVITRHEPKGLFLAAFFLLFALIMDLRKTFTFDARQRIVRWNLTIITPRATIPMAYAYSGHGDRYSTLRGQILDFVKPGSTIQSPEPGGSPPNRK
jgi:hypothetical protein